MKFFLQCDIHKSGFEMSHLMFDVSLIHKLFNQTVMGEQAFVKAYACFQTTLRL